jgi:two-component system, chemotaxis family, protein-glutamate methylesterase/glutaminase
VVYKVLVVDDSSFFQVRLKEIINEHPELNVVGVAANGHEAVAMAKELRPDIISMDYEMPYMDGVTAVKLILAERPVPIVMFSSLTYEGAKTTLDALAAGAVDFIPKNFAEVSRNSAALKRKLHETLITFAKQATIRPAPKAQNTAPAAAEPSSGWQAPARKTAPEKPAAPRANGFTDPPPALKPTLAPEVRQQAQPRSLKNRVKLVVIGSSTGGPVALTDVLSVLPASFAVPIVVVQHMPSNFTKALAERLDRQCQVRVKEAENGDVLQPGWVLIAPGGHQLLFDRGQRAIKIMPGDERMNYKPSVDITFASAANVFSGAVLGVVLTGMGADGCEGARLLKDQGSTIWGQNEASCVVYGMPRAVAKANLTDDVLALADIGPRLMHDL